MLNIPLPPKNKSDWPWTDPTPLTKPEQDTVSWPRISIVTPSYNQGYFIEETIRSVLLQSYPNLEYIIIDGNSDDDTLNIIKKYDFHLAHWVSEPDRGQAHAINKGFAQATGEVFGWLNSDDILLPGALFHLAKAFQQAPDAILMGEVLNVDEQYGYTWLEQPKNVTFTHMVEPWRHNVFWHQPGMYFPRQLYERVGSFDESLRYIFDRDWLCRALQIAPVHYLHLPLAKFRFHQTSKTVSEGSVWFEETAAVSKRYWPQTNPTDTTLAEAMLHLHHAEIQLQFYNWARQKGLNALHLAIKHDKRILTYRRFWLLALKATLPFHWLQSWRAIYLKYLRRFLFG